MWAIVKESSYSQDGGHGYGVYSTSYTEFIPFKTEKELLEWVDKNRGTKYNAIRFDNVEIETKVSIKTKPVKRSGGSCGPKCTCPDC